MLTDDGRRSLIAIQSLTVECKLIIIIMVLIKVIIKRNASKGNGCLRLKCKLLTPDADGDGRTGVTLYVFFPPFFEWWEHKETNKACTERNRK